MNVLDLIARCFRERPTASDAHEGELNGEPVLPRQLWERALLGPAADFLRRPGKGFRGRLVESGWALAGGGAEGPPPELPALVELVHAGSLILDDIQDGSSERRGAPALHHTVGTAVALNTGNWMVLWPIHLLGQIDLPPASVREAYDRVAATLVGCHQGQALDLLPVAELPQVDVAQVVAMSTLLRTASLTELAAVLGGLAAGAPAAVLNGLAELGRDLGRALQMLDDLGGLVSIDRRGKGYEDLRHGRPTWAWAWAAERAAEKDYDELRAMARRISAGDHPEPLRLRLAAEVEGVGRERARAALRRAWSRLSDRFPPSRARDQMAADLERLERSYG